MLFEFLTKIPDGWRFHAADWSIESQCRITLIRSGDNFQKWFKLSDNDQEKISLYAMGWGDDFESAFNSAIANCGPIEDDYQI